MRPDFLCGLAMSTLIAACSDTASTAPSVRELRHSGTVSAPAAGGVLKYKISGVWKLTDRNELISGADTTVIIDAKVYGYPGTVTMTLKTNCVAIVGTEVWGEQTVVTSTDPQAWPIGGVGVVRLSAAGGVARGGGGPKDAWYPTGNMCTDRPATLPLFEMTGGSVVIP